MSRGKQIVIFGMAMVSIIGLGFTSMFHNAMVVVASAVWG